MDVGSMVGSLLSTSPGLASVAADAEEPATDSWNLCASLPFDGYVSTLELYRSKQ